MKFKEVKKLDPGGPITVEGAEGRHDPGRSAVHRQQRHRPRLRAARRTTRACSRPTTRPRSSTKSKATTMSSSIIDAVNKQLTLDEYNKMAPSIVHRQGRPVEAAKAFLSTARRTRHEGDKRQRARQADGRRRRTSPVRSCVSQAYAQALKANGYNISFKDNIGPTRTAVPAREERHDRPLRRVHRVVADVPEGQPHWRERRRRIDVAGEAAEDGSSSRRQPAAAQDVNGFYVTKETADKYNLVKMSDLKQPPSNARRDVFGRHGVPYAGARRPNPRATSRARPIRRGAGARCRSSCRGRGPGARAFRRAA